MASAPTVMVSSTFYDLWQIRTDLARFIEDELSYQPLLSEYNSFPVDPDVDTIENCRRRVEQDADILVLVIGGRYGFVEEASSKSITNLEYLLARAKGIPVYAFIEKSVMSLLPVWERSPDADFSNMVDDVRLLEFIRQVRSVDKVWTQEFERAQDIITTLRVQFAHLMRESLQWRLQVHKQPEILSTGLRGKSLRLALEQPKAWEYQLFGQVLCDEVEASDDLRREHQIGFAMGFGEYVPLKDTGSWMQTRLGELRRIFDSLETLVNEHLQEALRPPGTSGDAKEIAFVARKIGAGYRHALEWSQRVRRAHVDECFRPVAREMALFVDGIIEKIQEYGPDLLQQIDDTLSAPPDGVPHPITATLYMGLSNIDRFQEELARAEEECL